MRDETPEGIWGRHCAHTAPSPAQVLALHSKPRDPINWARGSERSATTLAGKILQELLRRLGTNPALIPASKQITNDRERDIRNLPRQHHLPRLSLLPIAISS